MTGKTPNDTRDKKTNNKKTTPIRKTTPRTRATTKNTPANNKQTPKRDRSDLSSPEAIEPPKKALIMSTNDANKPLTIADIQLLFKEQTASIQGTIRDEMRIMGDDIKAEFQTKITQLQEQVEANKMNVQTQINEMKSDIAMCMGQSNSADDDLQRISKLNELKITGIVHANNENLNVIFSEIAKLVGFELTTVNNVPTVNRVQRWNPTSKTKTPTPIVIIKFVANHIRDDFYRKYMNKIATKPIMPEDINLPAGKQVIIGENLTVMNSKIFIEASKMKRENKLCTLFTQEGIVHVKAIKNEKATAIRSQRQLEIFIAAKASNVSAHKEKTATIPPTTTTPLAATTAADAANATAASEIPSTPASNHNEQSDVNGTSPMIVEAS